MLKLDQIKGDLMCHKLGNCSVAVEYSDWDQSVGMTIKDSRFTFIKDWANHYNDMLDGNDAWHEMQDVFHKYIKKALAKQGIKQGANIIRVGKKSLTVELVEGNDEDWYHDTFGKEHTIDCSYFVKDDKEFSSYGAASLMESAIDQEELLVDYLLYTDNLVAELKTQLRKAVVWLRDDFVEFTYQRHQLNELGLQFLIDGCNDLLKDYE
jgi:hypothetical protein